MWDRDIASVACRTNSSASREHRAIRDHACRSVQCHTSREQSAQDCRFQRGWKESGDRPGSAVADPPVPSGVRGSNRGEATVGLVWLVAESVLLEQQALREPRQTIAMLVLLGAIAIGIRWRTMVLARSGERGLQFEEEAAPAILELGLYRDGAVLGGRSSAPPTTP